MIQWENRGTSSVKSFHNIKWLLASLYYWAYANTRTESKLYIFIWNSTGQTRKWIQAYVTLYLKLIQTLLRGWQGGQVNGPRPIITSRWLRACVAQWVQHIFSIANNRIAHAYTRVFSGTKRQLWPGLDKRYTRVEESCFCFLLLLSVQELMPNKPLGTLDTKVGPTCHRWSARETKVHDHHRNGGVGDMRAWTTCVCVRESA